MIAEPTSTWVAGRFSRRPHGTAAKMPAVPEHPDRERGDHDLNPGLEPILPIKPAAVLVPLIDRPDGLTVVLTHRTNHLPHHPGQVCFPGGRIEPGDESPEATALRETEEEIGLEPRRVRLIGRLDPYVTRTGFMVTPVVGVVRPPLAVTPDPHEVAEVFEVPLSFLLDPRNHQRCTSEFDGVVRFFYAMPYGRHYIWGATAGMLMNLYEFLRET